MVDGLDLQSVLKESNEEVKHLEEECNVLMEILLRKRFKNIAEMKISSKPNTKRRRLSTNSTEKTKSGLAPESKKKTPGRSKSNDHNSVMDEVPMHQTKCDDEDDDNGDKDNEDNEYNDDNDDYIEGNKNNDEDEDENEEDTDMGNAGHDDVDNDGDNVDNDGDEEDDDDDKDNSNGNDDHNGGIVHCTVDATDQFDEWQ